MDIRTHVRRPDGATHSTRSPQEEWHFQAGWRRATARLWPEVLEARRMRRKQDHGCIDAYCARCDNPNPEK